jgi:hypothetical protein
VAVGAIHFGQPRCCANLNFVAKLELLLAYSEMSLEKAAEAKHIVSAQPARSAKKIVSSLLTPTTISSLAWSRTETVIRFKGCRGRQAQNGQATRAQPLQSVRSLRKMTGLNSGLYNITLDSHEKNLKGQTVVTNVNGDGLTVNWAASSGARRLLQRNPVSISHHLAPRTT